MMHFEFRFAGVTHITADPDEYVGMDLSEVTECIREDLRALAVDASDLYEEDIEIAAETIVEYNEERKHRRRLGG